MCSVCDQVFAAGVAVGLASDEYENTGFMLDAPHLHGQHNRDYMHIASMVPLTWGNTPQS